MSIINPFNLTQILVLKGDEECVSDYNRKVKLQLDHFPEPYVGNSGANVYILGGNPGYDERDSRLLENPQVREAFGKIIKNSYQHKNATFYWLDQTIEKEIHEIVKKEFGNTTDNFSGFKWWKNRTNELRTELNKGFNNGIFELKNRIFYIDYHPYHSLHLNTELMKNLPSNQYVNALICQAINDNKLIIIMRAYNAWIERIPKLKGYGNIIRLKSAQCSYLTPKNMLINEWSELLRMLKI